MSEKIFDSLKDTSVIVDLIMERPSKYKMLLSFAQEILREESFLSKEDRELIATFTSNLNNCKYCTGSHKLFTKTLGVSEEEINLVLSQNYSGHRLESILDYVKKLTISPSLISKNDAQKVFNAGFSQDELKDAIAVCSAFNLFNRLVEGYKIQENQQTWSSAAEKINKFGYDRRYEK